ncbi:phosphorylase family protein [Desulfosoma caldarium]|uniref:Futalosine hydrolase n=1 Tax=Desulfosoma caldarium TaxID=610254 RepID=A0A3N1VQ90_9BACT|nr:hypothetical protein [Desulfosoma caldarium]ROR03218.1 futalosine hydrolase [Desulfosoma caldarium]
MEESFEALDVLIVGAVPLEVKPLEGWLRAPKPLLTPWTTLWAGRWGRLRVGLACLGIGKVNAAAGSAVLIERCRPAMVWVVGSAGAYSKGPLSVGDVLVSTSILLGDEGVWERAGMGSMKALGFAVGHERGRPVFERFDLSEDWALKWAATLTPAGWYTLGTSSTKIPTVHPWAEDMPKAAAVREPKREIFQVAFGPSVTVGMSSGDAWIAEERFTRYGAWAEDMEGSAVVQVCRRYGVPVVQCRGISNRAGERDKSLWCMDKALAHSHAVLGTWLDGMKTAA